uniref:Immunoglobulin V-set domain-containing protein n=1 Tax=Periophthalmus magnuspinnatus TaxID=409849 RepID=A0A3B4A9A1_9GOBI
LKCMYLFFAFFFLSLQLKCDRTQITVHVGGEFVLCCTYNTDNFLFSKKYWCRGSSHRTCEVLADSETKTRQRWTVADATRRGLFIKVTGLRFEDAGMYWVGIDKIYADVMTSVEVVVTEGMIKYVSVLFGHGVDNCESGAAPGIFGWGS